MVQKKNIQIKIPLAKPLNGVNIKKLDDYFKEVIKSGFLTQGKFLKKFEENIKNFFEVKYAIGVSSGTAALHLSLIAIGIKEGDEVILPAFTFPATANVVELLGGKPVFVDVDLKSFNIQIENLEKKITSKTRGIIPVHLFGNPCQIVEIKNIAEKYGLFIIEDAAGAIGSEIKGKKCGTFGDIGCFSFHPRKTITTGEGGMVITNNTKLAKRIKILRNHGIDKKKKDLLLPGFNYRMNEIEAFLGHIQMLKIREIIKERRRIFEYYKKMLLKIPFISIQEVIPENQPVFQTLVIYSKRFNSEKIINYLKKYGIESTIGTYAVPFLTYYRKKYGYKKKDFPNAYKLYKNSVALPFYNYMRREEIKFVTEKLKEVF